jgi:hypothetical protein
VPLSASASHPETRLSAILQRTASLTRTGAGGRILAAGVRGPWVAAKPGSALESHPRARKGPPGGRPRLAPPAGTTSSRDRSCVAAASACRQWQRQKAGQQEVSEGRGDLEPGRVLRELAGHSCRPAVAACAGRHAMRRAASRAAGRKRKCPHHLPGKGPQRSRNRPSLPVRQEPIFSPPGCDRRQQWRRLAGRFDRLIECLVRG